MKSVLILQNEIKPYRKPVYNGLAAFCDVVVLHSGTRSVTANDSYREIITPQQHLWRFHLQPKLRLRNIIESFDVVIAMFDLSWPLYIAPLFWRTRPKYVLWGHWYSTSRVSNFVRNYLMKRADKLLMYGSEEVQRMISCGISSSKIVVAPNTVHVPNSLDYSSHHKSSLLFIGRLESAARRNSKRVDILISVFARLQGLIPDNLVLDIVGSGDEKECLIQLATKLNILDKVFFHGHVDDNLTISQLFATSIALVSPGHVGLSVLQSFAHGVPVVTGKSVQYRRERQHLFNLMTGNTVIMGPEYYNLLHNHNSLLVETSFELELALKQLCTNSSYAAELGRNAFQYYVRERSLSRMLEGFRQVIEE